ncbi:hypothetical protein E2320_007422, partial [Naja naja]
AAGSLWPAVARAGPNASQHVSCPLVSKYKEKLPSKCFQKQASNKERFSDSLNGQRWRFLKSGLDDFRSGYLPPSDNLVIQGTKGPAPIILQYKKLDPSQIVPYKSGDLRRKRTALTRTSPDYSKDDATIPSPTQYHIKYDLPANRSYSATLPWVHKKKNPYTWFSKKEVAQRQQAAKIDYVPPLDENVKRVTKEFCEWVNEMLFDTRYESDIKTATPIKIVELYQIPAELRQFLGGHPGRKRIPTKITPSEPKWEKIKYGAWYLPPKTWKKKRATEKEEIPECLQIFLKARKKIVQKFLLQMLAAGHSDKIAEDSELLSRKLSM